MSAARPSDSEAPDPKPVPDPLVVRYLDWLATGRKLAEHTLASYGHDLSVLQTHAARHAPGVALLALETHHIRSFAARMHGGGLSARTIARTLSAWRGFYLWAARHGHGVAVNPVDGVRAPKRGQPLPKALSVEHAVALVAHRPGDSAEARRDQAVFELFYSSGLRLSELVQLDLRYTEDGAYRLDRLDRPGGRRGHRDRQGLAPALGAGGQQGDGGAAGVAGRARHAAAPRRSARGRPRAVPRHARQAAVRGHRAVAHPQAGDVGRRADPRASAHAAPLIRHAYAAVVRRPARGAGDARPRQHRHDRSTPRSTSSIWPRSTTRPTPRAGRAEDCHAGSLPKPSDKDGSRALA